VPRFPFFSLLEMRIRGSPNKGEKGRRLGKKKAGNVRPYRGRGRLQREFPLKNKESIDCRPHPPLPPSSEGARGATPEQKEGKVESRVRYAIKEIRG